MEAATVPAAPLNAETAPLDVDEDDDDYEPDYYIAEDTEQILNKLDSNDRLDREAAKAQTASLALGAFRLPPPRSLDHDLAMKVGQGTINRVFGIMQSSEDVGAAKKPRAGLNRLAAGAGDRDAWITVLTRLATRSTAALDDGDDVVVKSDDSNGDAPKTKAAAGGPRSATTSGRASSPT